MSITRIKSPTDNRATLAVRVSNAPLVHTTQLLPPAGTAAGSQPEAVLAELDRLLAGYDARRSDVVKLNVYVKSSLVREAFLKTLSTWSKGGFPAVACIATPLPRRDAEIGLDAVFVSRLPKTESAAAPELIQKSKSGKRWAQASLLPLGDVVYVSGQAQPGELPAATRSTLKELEKTLEHLGFAKESIIQVKCFLKPMSRSDAVNREIEEFFGESTVPPVSHVEWISGSLPIEIELVAAAPAKAATETVSYITPPWMKSSPVFSRVARVHGKERIYLSGLYSQKAGTGEEEVRSVFDEMRRILEEAGSGMRHLAKATYYVASDDASSQLNRLRPEYYDPKRPPAASKAAVLDIGIAERSLTVDMIAAPKPASGR